MYFHRVFAGLLAVCVTLAFGDNHCSPLFPQLSFKRKWVFLSCFIILPIVTTGLAQLPLERLGQTFTSGGRLLESSS